MAADSEAVTRQSQTGYKRFCRLVGLSTLGVVAALGLMGLFLL
jgi:hypothetical protein